MSTPTIKSTYFQTEMIFHNFNGIVESRDGFYKIETPNFPNYYWGNLLYFPNPPKKGDSSRWKSLFHSEFSNNPEVKHMTFAWDNEKNFLTQEEQSEAEQFVKLGFALEDCLTLELNLKRDPILKKEKCPSPSNLQLRMLKDQDWEQAVSLALKVWPNRLDHPCSENFVITKMKNYKDMIDAKIGFWMGAFVKDTLVAALGLFFSPEVGRFQMVHCDEKFRRQGLTTALILATLEKVKLENLPPKLIIVADPDSVPAKLYQSVGFKFVERHLGVCCANMKDRTKK